MAATAHQLVRLYDLSHVSNFLKYKSKAPHVRYHTFHDFPTNYPLPGIIVPQEVYRPPTTEQLLTQGPIVRFTRVEPAADATVVVTKPGIRLKDAKEGNFINLVDASTTPVLTNAYRTSIRILVSIPNFSLDKSW